MPLYSSLYYPLFTVHVSVNSYANSLLQSIYSNIPQEGVDPEALDPDIQQEFEAFIDEIEEHLMMQEFGPESEEQQDSH